MAKQRRIYLTSSALCIAVGVVLNFLPHNWMEMWLGVAPDGDSGALELLAVSLPVALGFGLAILAYRSAHPAIASTSSPVPAAKESERARS